MRIFSRSNFEETQFLCDKNGQMSQKKRVYNENKEFKELKLM